MTTKIMVVVISVIFCAVLAVTVICNTLASIKWLIFQGDVLKSTKTKARR